MLHSEANIPCAWQCTQILGRRMHNLPDTLVLGAEHSAKIVQQPGGAFQLPLLQTLFAASPDCRHERHCVRSLLCVLECLAGSLAPLRPRQGLPRGGQLLAGGRPALALRNGSAQGVDRVAAHGRAQPLLRQRPPRRGHVGRLQADALGLPNGPLQVGDGAGALSLRELDASGAPPLCGQRRLEDFQLLVPQTRSPTLREGRLQALYAGVALGTLEASPCAGSPLFHGQDLPRLPELGARELCLVALGDGTPQRLDVPALNGFTEPPQRGHPELLLGKGRLRATDLQVRQADGFALTDRCPQVL
mmetsp:Transcript_21568/g.67598  ORF Transcript_21568/g.67598 Transcript_21568/m.67598 type:complete len:304 (-) Transcript_21568:898-1809(-)